MNCVWNEYDSISNILMTFPSALAYNVQWLRLWNEETYTECKSIRTYLDCIGAMLKLGKFPNVTVNDDWYKWMCWIITTTTVTPRQYQKHGKRTPKIGRREKKANESSLNLSSNSLGIVWYHTFAHTIHINTYSYLW